MSSGSFFKSKNSTSSSQSDKNNTVSKANYQKLEQERNLLKITLDYVAKENEGLKGQLEDMKMTVKHNKDLLREYVEKITNKDKVVEKMNATIEQLTSRMHTLEDYIKQNKNKKENIPTNNSNNPVPCLNCEKLKKEKFSESNNTQTATTNTISFSQISQVSHANTINLKENSTTVTNLTNNSIAQNISAFIPPGKKECHMKEMNYVNGSPSRNGEEKLKEVGMKIFFENIILILF
jgi:predicted RNase H-like nuclease (RuvC/YqgF family)